jgi:excinuclease ABC subunit A
MRDELSKYQDARVCRSCGGHRLNQQALSIKIDGLHIGQVSSMPVERLITWFNELPRKLTKTQQQISERLLKERKFVGDTSNIIWFVKVSVSSLV